MWWALGKTQLVGVALSLAAAAASAMLIQMVLLPRFVDALGEKKRDALPRSGSGACMVLCSVAYRDYISIGMWAPLTGLLATLTLSIYYNFESVTYTHCGVANVIPSISACIGDHTPQRYIWRLCIALMVAQRSSDGFIYRAYFRERFVIGRNSDRASDDEEKPAATSRLLERKDSTKGSRGSERRLPPCRSFERRNALCNWLFQAEQVGLLLLTCVSSSENVIVHQLGFLIFLVAGVSHSWLWLHMYEQVHWPEKNADRNFDVTSGDGGGIANGRDRKRTRELWCYSKRRNVAMVNSSAAACALIAYAVHSTVCIPFLYSFFASCEWVFVLTNICFHHYALGDFWECRYALLNVVSKA